MSKQPLFDKGDQLGAQATRIATQQKQLNSDIKSLVQLLKRSAKTAATKTVKK